MKNTNRKKFLGLSVAAALLLSTSMYAGKIITNATYDANITNSSAAIVTANKQFGFGGWNLENVVVKVVSITDYTLALVGSWFDELTGEYSSAAGTPATAMSAGMSFESDIYSRDGSNEIRGRLHGKDWPVGQPSGIKIINDDLLVHEGDPTNCIITSSYLDPYYLDNVGNERPTICSSPYQTHKRFKINMQPSTVDAVDSEGYGKPIDLVFNLDMNDTSTTIRTYQVLQKINNYTGVVLDGYKLELLDGNGNKNANLTLSLGKEDIEDLANYSSGLWGAADESHGTDDGFFDNVKAYYPVALSTDQQTISWHGNIQGGNYMAVFRSNWLYSTVAPDGYFYDDDNDSTTDALIQAFYGVPPTLPDATPKGWYKGEKDNWVAVTPEELAAWQANPQYFVDIIEDVLNLGITYNVNIGDNAQIPTGKFIIRITPHLNDTVADSSLPVSTSDSGSGGGFDALDKTSFIAMILGFLGIGAFIARRRLAKLKS